MLITIKLNQLKLLILALHVYVVRFKHSIKFNLKILLLLIY